MRGAGIALCARAERRLGVGEEHDALLDAGTAAQGIRGDKRSLPVGARFGGGLRESVGDIRGAVGEALLHLRLPAVGNDGHPDLLIVGQRRVLGGEVFVRGGGDGPACSREIRGHAQRSIDDIDDVDRLGNLGILRGTGHGQRHVIRAVAVVRECVRGSHGVIRRLGDEVVDGVRHGHCGHGGS